MQSKCEGGGFEYRNIVICMLVQNTVSDHSGEKKENNETKTESRRAPLCFLPGWIGMMHSLVDQVKGSEMDWNIGMQGSRKL